MFQLSTVKPVYNVKRIKSTWSYDFNEKTTLSKTELCGFCVYGCALSWFNKCETIIDICLLLLFEYIFKKCEPANTVLDKAGLSVDVQAG